MNSSREFGLIEVMVVLVIASLLLTIAVPAYEVQSQRAKISRAVGEIGTISIEIERFRLKNLDRAPDSLAELDIQIALDPWGEPYRYLNIMKAGPAAGALRKDGKLKPLNTDFDLYSMGMDRDSKGPLSANASRDDIVRANNGAFIGLGDAF
jgi:general secretion pathway protein G